MAEAVRPRPFGYIHAFGTTWFIMQFLKGNAPHGSAVIDPARGAPQADIHSSYKLALHTALAEDLAVRDAEEGIKKGRSLSPDQVDARRGWYLDRIPSRLTRARYNSFCSYCSRLMQLGWLERTGEEEPSLPQEIWEGARPRVYYRLTPGGMAADVPLNFDPIMALHPEYTREKRSGKKRLYFEVPERGRYAPPPRTVEAAIPVPTVIKEAEAVIATEEAKAVIAKLQGIPDEAKKAESIRKIEKVILQIPPDVLDAIENLDGVDDAIASYRGITAKGMTPEDYQAEKESAWQEFVDSLEALELIEE